MQPQTENHKQDLNWVIIVHWAGPILLCGPCPWGQFGFMSTTKPNQTAICITQYPTYDGFVAIIPNISCKWCGWGQEVRVLEPAPPHDTLHPVSLPCQNFAYAISLKKPIDIGASSPSILPTSLNRHHLHSYNQCGSYPNMNN